MPALAELQAAFRAALLDGAEAPAAALIAGDGLAPSARLAIYRHHVLSTLTAALESTYPVVCRLVDRRFFGYAADVYIRRHPPTGPCLFEYGESFPAFLAGFPPCRALAWLPDIAALEWALHRAVHADEAAPLAPEALAAVPKTDVGRLVLRLDPSVTLLRSRWPIDEIWRANQPDRDGAADLDAGPVRLEVRRCDDEAAMRALPASTWEFRRALAEGQTLAASAGGALATDPAFDLAQALHALLAERLLVGFSVTTTREASP